MRTGMPHPRYKNEDHAEAANKWCHTPNLVESDTGKFTSPRECSWYCTNIGEDNVAAILSSIVAFIGILPDTICTVGTFRFSNHIMKHNLGNNNTIFHWNIQHMSEAGSNGKC